MIKKIGVIGSGGVGQALASGFVAHGYEVVVGSREPAKLAGWVATTGGRARAVSVEEAAAFGDAIVLAVKGMAAEEVVRLAGPDRLAGKPVFDATNPIADAAPTNGVLHFFTTLEESLMERLQKLAPKANFVKAFSSVGSALFVDPKLAGGRPSMFICGNSADAKKEAVQILDQFGWDAEDMGSAEAARAIEPLCMLWCIPGFLHNDWVHAFKMLRK